MLNRITHLLLLIILFIPVRQPAKAQDESAWLLGQINALRAGLGLPAYTWNPSLGASAQGHSEWMAATGNISHDQDNGSSPNSRARAAGYNGSYVAENIYGGLMATAQHAWNFWLNSPIHYAGMTADDYQEIGIGIAKSEHGTFYTLNFGRAGRGYQAPPVEPVQPQYADDNQVIPQEVAAAPTQAPIVQRPRITWTPSPTIPTHTPTNTWTPTHTWTPSPTATIAPPTSTPIVLPGVVAVVSTEMIETPVQLAPISTSEPAPKITAVAASEEGFDWKLLLPLLLLGQALMITGTVWWMFRRAN